MESEIRILESVSATLMGMRFDVGIPPHARDVLIGESERLDRVIEALIQEFEGNNEDNE